jgi:hypothetical protein
VNIYRRGYKQGGYIQYVQGTVGVYTRWNIDKGEYIQYVQERKTNNLALAKLNTGVVLDHTKSKEER